MSDLNPTPGQLDLESPALGPWFIPDVTLAAPRADLSVAVMAAPQRAAYPPATGLLTYAVATDPRPEPLRSLRQPDGTPAFTNGNLVALFTLSPEVEQRLSALSMQIAPANGTPQTLAVPTRPTVRYLAYEFTEDDAEIDLLRAVAAPPIDETAPDASSAADEAAHLGLTLGNDGTSLANGPHPMTDLCVAGQWLGERDAMLTLDNLAFTLWAFDDAGRAIDPGAVAAWWNHLNTLFTNLWAPGPNPEQRTTSFDPQLIVHLVNPSEGVLDQDLLDAVDTTALTGSGAVLVAGNNGAALSFTDPPGANDAPVAMAMLPNGTYGSTVTLYPNGPVHNDLTRDYVRVGVLDIEVHLTGQPREAADGASDEARRRADDQKRATTRVAVNRVAPANLTLHTSLDTAATAVLSGLGTNPSTFVMPTLDREYSSLSAPTLPTTAPPVSPPTITARALTGGEFAPPNSRIDDQIVLLQLDFGGYAGAGAWVRVWPHGFDTDDARHVALDGGAGVMLADGTANVIVRLPFGITPGDDGNMRAGLADAGCDVSVATASGSTTFADVRFDRPAPVEGDAIAFADAAQPFACETGPLPSAVAPRPGSSLFSQEGDDSFALIDPATVPPAGFPGTIDALIADDDTVCLTAPAFVAIDPGDVQSNGDLSAGSIQRAARTGLTTPVPPGFPHPTMELLEAAVASVPNPGTPTATIAPAAGLRLHHELPPHMLGHPGAPAAREAAGVGVTFNGAPALAVAEFARDRANPATPALVSAAQQGLPTTTPPGAPTPWVAVLSTIGFGVDGEVGLGTAIRAAGDLLPALDDVEDVVSWLETAIGAIPGSFDPTGDVPRALMRRVRSAGWGRREVATSLTAAFGRAEELVYIETPAIDALAIGADGDVINPVQTLIDRVRDRPGLHVVLCLPRRPPPGWPAKLGRVRDALAREVIEALTGEGGDRVAVFHPTSGRDRALDLASTTVVVDDNYALAGTSHLWRRGLSFDGGLAAAVFDERLTMGRPTVVRTFRLTLVGQRLGAAAANLPLDSPELVRAIRGLARSAGSGRVTVEGIAVPDPVPTATDVDLWNRDGSAIDGFDPFTWLTNTDVQSEFVDVVP